MERALVEMIDTGYAEHSSQQSGMPASAICYVWRMTIMSTR